MSDNKISKMPINYEAEKAMLASLMMDPVVAGEYTTQLNEADFALLQNKEIFKAIHSLINENKAVDILTVSDKLTITDKMTVAGGMEYLTAVLGVIPSAANADEYFDIVKRNSLLREIIDAGNKISKCGYSSEDSDRALDYAESTVFQISEKHESSKLVQIAAASAAALNKINAVQHGDYTDDGIKTGYDSIDKKIESLKPGSLCILAARPSVGKTAFALTIAINAAVKKGKKVAIFSYEMPVVQLVTRMLTTLSQVSIHHQKTSGMMSFNETARLVNAHEALTASKIYVDENAGNKPADIISKCRRLKNSEGLDLVIIDYLQLISPGEKKENRQQEVSEISRKMKLFAKELNVPFLVLSQLSRGIEQRGDEPQLSDLRESGSIEQDADMVFFLHHVKKTTDPEEAVIAAQYEKEGPRFIKFLISKNRNGPLGSFYFDWNGDLQTFRPIDIVKGDDIPKQAIKVNKEITSLNQLNDAFEGLSAVEGKGEAEEIVDETIVPIKEAPLNASNAEDLYFTNNESGYQSNGEIDGEIPF